MTHKLHGWLARPFHRTADDSPAPSHRTCRECGTVREALPSRQYGRLLDCAPCAKPTLHLQATPEAIARHTVRNR